MVTPVGGVAENIAPVGCSEGAQGLETPGHQSHTSSGGQREAVVLSESRSKGPPEKAGTVVGLETGVLPKTEKKGEKHPHSSFFPSSSLLPVPLIG